MTMLETIGIISLLLVLSAFFSGSETALTAASRHVMHHMEQSGDTRAKLVNRLRDNNERLIGAILLGNNLVNILGSALATSLMIDLFGEAGIAYATLGMTLLVLIFAEVLPKTYAINTADRMALAVAPAISALVAVLSPFTLAINAVVRGTLKIFGAGKGAAEPVAPPETELRGAIELHEGAEEVGHHERAMLRSVLDLDDVQVSEIMTHRRDVVALDVDTPPAELVRLAVDSPYTRIPIWKNDIDNIVGVVHAKALLRKVADAASDIDKIDITELATAPWFIPDQTQLLDQLHAFRERREHFALVVDEYGSFLGIVTLEDILEEIVGEIDDEHDDQVSGVETESDGIYLIDGRVTIRDLNREFEWGLPDEEAATIAGLVLHEARRIPEVGQRFMFHGLRFDIVQRKRHQITKIRVTAPRKAPGAADSKANGGS
jgi:Mg2+/Co2+ transporter CorB